jgi:hypothetical protein
LKLDYVLEVFEELKGTIRKFEDCYGDLDDEFEFNRGSSVEKYKNFIAKNIMADLFDIHWMMKWVDKPILAKGTLVKRNDDGRYEIEGMDISFTSGRPLEVWDEYRGHYVISRIEHNTKDYYIVALGKTEPIAGVKVRVR